MENCLENNQTATYNITSHDDPAPLCPLAEPSGQVGQRSHRLVYLNHVIACLPVQQGIYLNGVETKSVHSYVELLPVWGRIAVGRENADYRIRASPVPHVFRP